MENRVIKFRGKRIDNQEWIFGKYLQSNFHSHISIMVNCMVIGGKHCDDLQVVAPTVYSESIGQFTGLLDKNGNGIYEGDIIKWPNLHGSVIGKIVYEKQAGAFWLKWDIFNEHRYKELAATFGDGETYRIDHFEIIGNIFENQELLQ